MKSLRKLMLLTSLSFLFATSGYAEEFVLKNGSRVKGLVLQETAESVVVNTSYGQFNIEKSSILERNRSSKKRPPLTVSAVPVGYTTISNTARDKMPWGGSLSVQAAYQIDKSKRSGRSLFLPYLFGELEYLKMGGGNNQVSAGILSVGPAWSIGTSNRSDILLAAGLGLGFYDGKTKNQTAAAFKLTTSIVFGFRYYLQKVSVLPQIRYSFIHDDVLSVNRIGFGLGVGRNF